MRRIINRNFLCLAFLFLGISGFLAAYGSQDNPARDHALLPESVARRSAINLVMPIYPEEAEWRGISRLVRIKIEITPNGDPLKIKFKPRTEPLLREAVVSAAKQWKFKPWLGPEGVGVAVISRLTFHFVISNGLARVEMYDPGPDSPWGQCLGCYDSARELREWREWEEVMIDKSSMI